MVSRAAVHLWGREIGAVLWDGQRDLGRFEYRPDFLASNIQIAPLTAPLRAGVFDFPDLPRASFKGLPGFLADSLPDRFGNALIDAWLAKSGRSAASMNPVERLCYTGTRGMGALEFRPATPTNLSKSEAVDIAAMADLANAILSQRASVQGAFAGQNDAPALAEILRIGTSAGGARAKAVLAWNPVTGQFRSGQVGAGQVGGEAGFEHWLLKFDGVARNGDKELADPQGFGRIEYACALVARAAGVTMAPCRLHIEGGRAHFMTQRFDRRGAGKLHMLSLAAMRHFDFNLPRAYSYEQAVETLRLLRAPSADIHQQLRRAYLNVMLRNQDDHVKNIAYLMDKAGQWRLSPAFDVCYAYNPSGQWTSQHQMLLNGKADGFTMVDLLAFARYCDVKPKMAARMIDEVRSAVLDWPKYAAQAGVPKAQASAVQMGLRVDLPAD